MAFLGLQLCRIADMWILPFSIILSQWRLVPPLSEENKHFPVAFPIAFTSKKFVVIGNTEGVATIIGIQQYQNVLTEAYIATSHLINSYIIAIGI